MNRVGATKAKAWPPRFWVLTFGPPKDLGMKNVGRGKVSMLGQTPNQKVDIYTSHNIAEVFKHGYCKQVT